MDGRTEKTRNDGTREREKRSDKHVKYVSNLYPFKTKQKTRYYPLSHTQTRTNLTNELTHVHANCYTYTHTLLRCFPAPPSSCIQLVFRNEIRDSFCGEEVVLIVWIRRVKFPQCSAICRNVALSFEITQILLK